MAIFLGSGTFVSFRALVQQQVVNMLKKPKSKAPQLTAAPITANQNEVPNSNWKEKFHFWVSRTFGVLNPKTKMKSPIQKKKLKKKLKFRILRIHGVLNPKTKMRSPIQTEKSLSFGL